MKAVVIREHGGPEVLGTEEVADPVPGPGEVLVRVRACALNHLDLWVRQGLPGAPFELPLIPGADVAGEIAGHGPGVADPAEGTPVMVAPGLSCGHCAPCSSGRDHLCPRYGILGESRDGGMAELVVVPRANVVPKPERLDWAEAASLQLSFLTAWHMLLDRAELRPGETVLVQAAGSGVGTAAVQIASWLGAEVIATAGAEHKLATARELGAHHTIDYAQQDFRSEVKQLTGRRGVDVVFDHLGGEVLEQGLRCLGRAGRLVTCGATTGAEARVSLRHLFFKSQSLLGSTMGSRGEFHEMVRLFDRGLFRAVVHRTLPLDDAGEAHRLLGDRQAVGKVVVQP